MPQPVWLEVALNGPFGPKRQPHAPYTAATLIQEGLACARAGAAIVHLHVYDEATGIQNDAPETYVRVIEAIVRRKTSSSIPPCRWAAAANPAHRNAQGRAMPSLTNLASAACWNGRW